MAHGVPVPPMLIKANRLFNLGQFEEAAGLYETMATAIAQQGGTRAPYTFIHAGKAYFRAGQIQPGKEQVMKGITLLAERGGFSEARRACMKAVAVLKTLDHPEDAQKLEAWLKGILKGQTLSEDRPLKPIGMPKRLPLPLYCPKCGAPIDPTEVTWVDQITAVCTFCGNLLRGDAI